MPRFPMNMPRAGTATISPYGSTRFRRGIVGSHDVGEKRLHLAGVPFETASRSALVIRRVPPSETPAPSDRKSVVEGKSVSVRLDLGGGRIIKKKKSIHTRISTTLITTQKMPQVS